MGTEAKEKVGSQILYRLAGWDARVVGSVCLPRPENGYSLASIRAI